MNFSVKVQRLSSALLLILGMFSYSPSYAMRDGGMDFGNSYHPNDNYHSNDSYHQNGYYYGGFYGGYYGAPGVIVDVPYGGYPTCSTMQQCDSNGDCVENQVCN